MKKIFTIIILSLSIWSCAKKMAPANTNVPASNTGSVISNNTETPTAVINNTQPVNNTQPLNFQSLDSNNELVKKKSSLKDFTASPDVMAQIAGQSTYNAKCGRCHGLKVTTNYTADRWASILAVCTNSSRANLNDSEKWNVQAYVSANSKK